MNVIVSNKNKDVFSELSVDVLKSLNGEFTADEIIQSFSNFFFNRMFLDITAIENYTDIKNIQKLSIGLDVSKIILLLNDNEIVNSDMYKSKLVSMGIYNFTNDITGLKYLYDHPNSYKDVAHYQEINNVPSNFETKVVNVGVRVIGFKNVTEHAGATSLIYMLKNELSKRYNVVAIEVNKKDFFYYKDKDMVSINAADLGNTILKYKDVDIILVDLNDMDGSTLDGDVMYLIEPSVIKLNKLLLIDRRALSNVRDKKVILNMYNLSRDDIKSFENEASCNVFYALPAMNDKADNSAILLHFLEKLGLVKKVETDDDRKSGLFGFLKF